jgi:hypothetical protein
MGETNVVDTFCPPFPSLDSTKCLLALCSLEVLLGGEIVYIDHNILTS